MGTLGGTHPDNDVKLSSYNLRDTSKSDDTSSNDQKHRKRNSILPICHDDESTVNESNGKAINDAGKTTKSDTQKLQWLESLMVFCANVSVVGLRYVVNTSTSPYRRSIWFLLILGGAVFTTYQLQDRIRSFVSYPVNVVVRVEHVQEMRFPTVTICNENQVSLSKMTALGKQQSCEFCEFSVCLSVRQHISNS